MRNKSLPFYFIMASVFLLSFWGHAQVSCLSFYEGQPRFRAWSLEDGGSLDYLTADLFFPADYLQKLRAAYPKMRFRVSKDYDSVGKRHVVSLSFRPDNNVPFTPSVLKFSVWLGQGKDSAIIEDLGASDFLSTQNGKPYRGGRAGLPTDVFYHVSNAIYDFLKAGGIKKIEVNSSQNVLVYLLYRKIIGAKPTNEYAKNMYRLLREIKNVTIGSDIFEKPVKNVSDLNPLLGIAYTKTIGSPLTFLWNRFQNKDRAVRLLERFGVKKITDSRGELIGFTTGKSGFFIVPFLPGQPVLDWFSLHNKCPQCMMLVKELK